MSPMITLIVATFALSPAVALWPVPQELETGQDVLFINREIEVTYNDENLSHDADYKPPRGSNFTGKDVVQSGVSRALKGILDENFVPWKLRPRNSDFEPNADGDKTMIKNIKITQSEPDKPETFKPQAGDVDESYSLAISQGGEVTLECKTSTGCLYGLESFVQLFYKHSSMSEPMSYTPYAPIVVEDGPMFPHRGLIMDVARNWYPIEDIYRTLDAMSWNKMNRLHLHLTNTQSWPIEIPALPELAEKGAYSKGLTYSPDDIASIFEYATYRGISVIMEVDMPNHIEPPCGAFQMNNSKVYDFVTTLFDDLLPRILPYSAYMHTGGDEIYANDSAIDPTVQSNDTAVIAPLLDRFSNFTHTKVQEGGLTQVVWEDFITNWNQTLASDVVVQAWLGDDSVKSLINKGYKVIDSNLNFYYLDCGRGQWINYANGESFQKAYPFKDYCDPVKNWRLIYSHDPRAGLSGEAAERVLGGEVAAWSEMMDGINFDTTVWPRAAAAAEVWWSGRLDSSGQNRSQLDAAPRLSEMRERMVARGVRAFPVQMVYCTQGNKTECSL
ncbi:hypothetical protein CDD81_7168 [Ophiocordyceps australis]|uniref:Beta-hexosaminidase n=1 Tax=Ophiocordyceps australis TaxID=1399860 RepID=A0A2C5Y559_9HYPO|nr:hypothetical protein CDD81_7168 [Ophiocordyceps australis]